MLFVLSKIGWLFAAPSRVVLLVGLVGAAAGRRGRAVVAGALVVIALVSVVPVGGLALARLEATFPPLAAPGHIDGVLVIGGALDAQVFDAHPASGFNPAVGRLFEAARIAKAYPQARVFDIGGPTPADGRPEADAAADVLVALGVARERIETERASRNTYENAIDAAAIAKPKAGEVWLLVTSAFHMPRAVGCFRAAGFEVIADPVDYRWLGEDNLGFDPVGGWEALDLAVHEYVGLASYRLMGRTDALWPGP